MPKSLAVSFKFLTFAPTSASITNSFGVTEPIVFGSAFVSIYGKAFITFYSRSFEIWQFQIQSLNKATVDAHVVNYTIIISLVLIVLKYDIV